MFQDITQGPGGGTYTTYTMEILIMLIVAFLLGLILGYILWNRFRTLYLERQAEYDRLQSMHTDLEKEHASTRYKVEALDADNHGLRDKIMHRDADIAGWKAKYEVTAANLAAATAAATLEIGESRGIMMGAPATPPPVPDDLKIVEGIGPKIEKLLNDNSVWTFGQLSTTPVERLRSILDSAGQSYRIADPSTWARQAELARDGKWEELKEYQNYLTAGKDLSK